MAHLRERPIEVVLVSSDVPARRAVTDALRDDPRFHLLVVSSHPEAGWEAITALGPRVAIAGPGVGSAAIVKLLIRLRPLPAPTRVLAIVGLEETDEAVFRLVAAGVAGLFDAHAPAAQVVAAAGDVAAGRDVIAPAIQAALVRCLRRNGIREPRTGTGG